MNHRCRASELLAHPGLVIFGDDLGDSIEARRVIVARLARLGRSRLFEIERHELALLEEESVREDWWGRAIAL